MLPSLRNLSVLKCPVFLWLALLGCFTKPLCAAPKPSTLLLISIDGYRSDYTDRYKPPHLMQFIAKKASRAKGLIPIFPSLTFPNHYSIVTGLYAEHHGMIANRFFNRQTNQEFSIHDAEAANEGSWYGGTPLWVLAEQQQVKSACMFWPGSAALIQNTRPTYYKAYDPSITNRQRSDQILTWLQLPAATRPHFLTLYFSDVDTSGHQFGPESPQTAQALARIDDELGYLFAKLSQLPASLALNIVVVSDHGMQAIAPSHLLYLSEMIALAPTIKVFGDGSFSMLYIADLVERRKIYQQLKKQSALNVYYRHEVPASLHYRSDKNIGDIVISTKTPFFLVTTSSKNQSSRLRGGDHGYDPATTPHMQGIFYAKGPNIKPDLTLAAFENIHLFPLFAKLLDLKLPQFVDAQPTVSKLLYVPSRAAP